jgi:hypothetical protein
VEKETESLARLGNGLIVLCLVLSALLMRIAGFLFVVVIMKPADYTNQSYLNLGTHTKPGLYREYSFLHYLLQQLSKSFYLNHGR